MTLTKTNPDDLIQCEICGEKMKRLERHLYWKHNMTCSEYQELYNLPVTCSSVKKVCSFNAKQSDNLSKWMKENPEKLKKIAGQNLTNYNKSQKARDKDRQMIKEYYERLGNRSFINVWLEDENNREIASDNFFQISKNISDKKHKGDSRYEYFSERFSLKNIYRSIYETEFVKLLETYKDVVKVEYEVIKIKYYLDNQSHWYHPDFLVNKKYLFEIKSSKSGERFGSTINLKDREKHLAAYHYSLVNNLVFCLVNEDVILSDNPPLTFHDLLENTTVKLDDIV